MMLTMPARTLALATVFIAACAHGAPVDTSIEATFPERASAAPLPREFRVATFNLHGETGSVIARALAADGALRTADLLILEEVHRHHGCSTACEAARAPG